MKKNKRASSSRIFSLTGKRVKHNNNSIETCPNKLRCNFIMEENVLSVESFPINYVVDRDGGQCNETCHMPSKVKSPKYFGTIGSTTSTFHIVEHRDCTDMFVEYLENNGSVVSEGRQELVRILIRSPSEVSLSTAFKGLPDVLSPKESKDTGYPSLQLSPVYEKRGRFLVWPTRFKK